MKKLIFLLGFVMLWVSNVAKAQPYAYVACDDGKLVRVNFNDNSMTTHNFNFYGDPNISVSPDGATTYLEGYILAKIDHAVDSIMPAYAYGDRIAISTDYNRAYILHEYGKVFVINTLTNKKEDSVKVYNNTYSSSYHDILIDKQNKYLYVLADYNVYVVDARSMQLVNTLDIHSLCSRIAISPDGTKLYAILEGKNKVNVYSTINYNLTNTIVGLKKPQSIAFHPTESKIYIANFNSDSISIVDANTHLVTENIFTGLSPNGVSVSPDGTKLYVCNYYSKTLKVLNTSDYAVTAKFEFTGHPITNANITAPVYAATPCSAVSIETESNIKVYTGKPFVKSIVQSGFTMPDSWTITAGSLPNGVTFNRGNLYGAATTAGAFSFTVQVTKGNCSVSKVFVLNVVDCPQFSIASVVLPAAGSDGLSYSATIPFSGFGTDKVTLSYTGLPSGLIARIDSGKIKIMGYAYSPQTANVVFKLSNGYCSVEKSFVLNVYQKGAMLPDTLVYNAVAGGILDVKDDFTFIANSNLPPGSQIRISYYYNEYSIWSWNLTQIGVYVTNAVMKGGYNKVIKINVTCPDSFSTSADKIVRLGDLTASVDYAWDSVSIVTGSLPPGLTCGTSSGSNPNAMISGYPVALGTYNFTLKYTQGTCVKYRNKSITVVCPASTSDSPYNQQIYKGVYYDIDISEGFIGGDYTVQGTLPPGFSIVGDELQGNCNTAGVYNFSLTTGILGQCTRTRDYTITVDCYGYNTSVYEKNIFLEQYVSGVTSMPNDSLIIEGMLPPGLSFVNQYGGKVLTGTPTQTGTYYFSVKGQGCMQSQQFMIRVLCSKSAKIAQNSVPAGQKNVAYNIALTTLQFNSPVFSLWSGSLPAGLTILPNGQITGTPTQAGVFEFTVKAENGYCDISKTYLLEIAGTCEGFLSSANLADGKLNASYTDTLAVANSYAVTQGLLPNGLTISSAGIISGTPTVAGVFDFTVTAQRGACSASHGYQIRVKAGCSEIFPHYIAPIGQDSIYFQQLTADLDAPVFTLTHGSMPNGLTLGTDGVLSGMATTKGYFNFTVTATSTNCTVSKTYNVAVVNPDEQMAFFLHEYINPTAINLTSNTLAYTIPAWVGNMRTVVSAMNNDGSKVYINRYNASYYPYTFSPVRIHNSKTKAVLDSFAIGNTSNPWILNNPFSNKLSVYKVGVGYVELDATTNQVIDTLNLILDKKPVLSGDGNMLYFMKNGLLNGFNMMTHAINVVQVANQTFTSVPSMSVDGKFFYQIQGSTIKIFNLHDNTIETKTTEIPAGARKTLYSADGSKLYVISNNELSLIEAGSFKKIKVVALDAPLNMYVSNDDQKLYVVTEYLGIQAKVLVLNATTLMQENFFILNANQYNNTVAMLQAPRFVCPSVSFSAIAKGVQGNVYNQKIVADGLVAPIYTLQSGTLPQGLTLQQDGMLSGTPSQAGTFEFRVMAQAGVCTGFQTYQLTIEATCWQPSKPIIAGNSTICEGTPRVLSVANVEPNTSYVWSNGQTGTQINIQEAGNLTVQAISSGCTSAVSDPIQLSVNTVPSVSLLLVDNKLLASYIEGATYQWFLNGMLIEGATSQLLSTITTSGNYSAMATLGGCIKTSSAVSFVTNVKSSASKLAVEVYPNPSTGSVTLETGASGIVSVYDLVGHSLWTANVVEGKNDLDLTNLSAGMYLLKLQTKDGIANQRITIEK